MVGQVDVGQEGTVSGDAGVYFINCFGMEIFLWSKVDRVIFELGKVSLAFPRRLWGIRQSVLLAAQVVGARVDYNVVGPA